jgi:ABC-type polysaccharide/polyol phosphate transport system ATPase subunit
MDAITVQNLSKSFTIPHEKKDTLIEILTKPFSRSLIDKMVVLDDVSFQINTGETIGIIGVNGAGKSTLLKLLAKIYQPDSGEIRINGRLVPFLELGVGFNPELTGRENVFLNGIILGMTRKFLTEKFNDIVAFAELERFIDLPLKNYSSGMQVRLAFSIAFLSSADIYLLDEVFAVGDIAFQEKSKKVFIDLKKQGKTIILVSHSLPMLKEFVDKILILSKGSITYYDSVEEGITAYQELAKV